MKILTLTTYNVYNYGAALQAYALQTYLQCMGWNFTQLIRIILKNKKIIRVFPGN